MKLATFLMERMQSTWEHTVRFNLSESGAEPIALRDLAEMGLDIEQLASQPLGYSQTNGTLELRRALAAQRMPSRVGSVFARSVVGELELLESSRESVRIRSLIDRPGQFDHRLVNLLEAVL